MAKYLDTTGLTYFWGKVKAFVAQYVSEKGTGTTYEEATQEKSGLMSAADKKKLDSLEATEAITTAEIDAIVSAE